MATRETVQVNVSGYDLKLTADAAEKVHIERAARKVAEMIQSLQNTHGGAASPAKIATMAAFQLAYDLSVADEMLEEAERLHHELNREKDAVSRLESLLSRVDTALAY